mmetsp:Transcript_2672/g.9691  ORF Transcript_2672/g.9691 Transcript_2672/m.9691 type:complete len:1064 (+) Transcript_2672:125-3316(+)
MDVGYKVWVWDEERWRAGTITAMPAHGDGDGDGDGAAAELVSLVTDDEARKPLQARAADLHLRNEGMVEDMVRLDHLHEPGVLANVAQRYALDEIYTYSSRILIAVNPFRQMPHMYNEMMMAMYRAVPIGELSPHVYAIADASFMAMAHGGGADQSILVSGESGAGKTETAKLIMQYLGALSGKGSDVESRILSSSPVLEAFGNAKTVRNDNSSRFGKYMEIYFAEDWSIRGAAIRTYLLERSRVVKVAEGECSYHLFYQMIDGAERRLQRMLHLENRSPSQPTSKPFQMLTAKGGWWSKTLRDSKKDAQEFKRVMAAMEEVGISQVQRDNLLMVLAAILHLGDLTFEEKTDEHEKSEHHSNEGAAIDKKSKEALDHAAELLQVPSRELEKRLCTQTIKVLGSNESYERPLEIVDARKSRDSFNKALYSKLFEWLVRLLNASVGGVTKQAIDTHELDDSQDEYGTFGYSIGILDIYGFECFEKNSFEQLCINLANEHLQQQFNGQVLREEQELYKAEGINWKHVSFKDNQDVLDLLQGRRDIRIAGVFPTIDEHCRLPKATPAGLADSLKKDMKQQEKFFTIDKAQMSFGLRHYAGDVLYDCTELLVKNADSVNADHEELLTTVSKSQFVQDLFQMHRAAGDHEASKPQAGAGRRHAMYSVGLRFRDSLTKLMTSLKQTQPYYIRCIRPNTVMQPKQFRPGYIVEQLRNGGVLEAARVISAGFPTRRTYDELLARYNLLAQRYQHLDKKDQVKKILQAGRIQDFELGKTRVFMRAGALARLEASRIQARHAAATKIQAAARGKAQRNQYRKTLAAIACINKWMRGALARKRTRKLRGIEEKQNLAAAVIQGAFRGFARRRALQHKRDNLARSQAEADEAARKKREEAERKFNEELQLAAADQAVEKNVDILGGLDPSRVYQRVTLLKEMLMAIRVDNAEDVTQEAIMDLVEECQRDQRVLVTSLNSADPAKVSEEALMQALSLNDRLVTVNTLYEIKLRALEMNFAQEEAQSARARNFPVNPGSVIPISRGGQASSAPAASSSVQSTRQHSLGPTMPIGRRPQ